MIGVRPAARAAYATMVALVCLAPMRAAAQPRRAQAPQSRPITLPDRYVVLGITGGRPVYRAPDGSLRTLDPTTGQLQAAPRALKYRALPDGGELVTILEIDPKGNVLQKNAAGIAFYLNRKTGVRVFVKWPK